MAIDVAFKFLKIVIIREARKQKAGSARKDTDGVEVAVKYT